MGVARLAQVLQGLREEPEDERGISSKRDGHAFPANTPIAIIERGSMPDQRVITSTLQNMAAALQSVGEQRPPGMIIVGWSVLALWEKGDVGVLDEGPVRDDARIREWLGGAPWRIKEGLEAGWEML
jgi:uroporphyrin-III C-methyltransferase